MYKRGRIYMGVILALALLTGLSSFVITAQKKGADSAAQQPTGSPVLWRDPGDISTRNLLTGPAGDSMKPDLSKITYVRDEQTGYSVKYHVKDGAGRSWVVKVGNEARPETAAIRLVWAVGYATESNLLVPCVHIPNAAKPRKDVPRCEGDGFADARFEARPDDEKRLDVWSWKSNPFSGTKELKGLIVLMALMNNWDLKDENNRVISVKGANGDAALRYVVSDLGATFGKTGGAISHSRNEPENYAKSDFIKGVEGGKMRFAYSGKSQFLFDDITVDDARWITTLLMRLTDQQIADAFRAANFRADEAQLLTSTVRRRIGELARATGATQAPATTAPTASPEPMPEPTPEATPEATPTPEAAPVPSDVQAPKPTPETPPSDALPSPGPTPASTPNPGPTPPLPPG
jgi:hypothetical protein